MVKRGGLRCSLSSVSKFQWNMLEKTVKIDVGRVTRPTSECPKHDVVLYVVEGTRDHRTFIFSHRECVGGFIDRWTALTPRWSYLDGPLDLPIPT